MPHIHSNSSKPVTAVLVLVLASLALAACGGSSSTSSTTTTTSASATTPSTGGRPGAGGGRFAAIRECLKKNGITLPTRKPGQAPGAGGFLGGGGGFALPKGVTKAQYEAAFKKCGGFPRGGFRGGAGGFRGGAGVFKTAAGKQALAKFAACMRSNGINVPEPNTSGNGPVFNDKGIDTASAKFKEAEAKCRSALLGAFRAHPGAGGAAPGAAPGATNG
jgi:hypothetical protein